MKKLYKLIVFFNWFGSGLMMPVSSMILLSRGCTISTLSMAIGIYSAATIAMEVPSGIIADIYGRKKAYLLSCFAYIAAYCMICFSVSFWTIIPAMLVQGVGRAFSSGSLDALAMEEALLSGKSSGISDVASSFLVWQSIGIAAGSLISGLIPDFGSYSIHLSVRIGLLTVIAVFTILFVRDIPKIREERVKLKEYLISGLRLIKEKTDLRYVILCICVGSIMMFTLEMYWQPALSGIIKEKVHMWLGVLGAVSFAATAFGSFLAGKLDLGSIKRSWTIYILLLTLTSFSIIVLAHMKNPVGFAVCFVLWYLFLGAGNVPEQTILNSVATNESRGFIMSLGSLTSQLGGIISSVACTALIGAAGYSGVWMGSGVLMLLMLAAAAPRIRKNDCLDEKIPTIENT